MAEAIELKRWARARSGKGGSRAERRDGRLSRLCRVVPALDNAAIRGPMGTRIGAISLGAARNGHIPPRYSTRCSGVSPQSRVFIQCR
jgi:hypothetical protein